MKKRLLIWAVALLIPAVLLLNIPNMVQSGIPSIYYITPSVKFYENMVNCQGTVESESIYGIYAPSAFVPGDVMVSVGDMVSDGDLLLTTDDEATKSLSMGSAGGVIAGITGEAANALPQLDAASILSSILPGILGAGIDMEGVAETLQRDEGVSAETKAVVAESGFKGIYAPAAGVITEVNTVPGSPTAQGKALFIIQDIKNYKVIASVSEGDIAKIQIGDIATVRGPGFSGASFKGTVTKVYPTAHKALSGTGSDTVVDVEIKISAPNNKLRHGFSAKVEIAGGQSYELITVPYEAIRQDSRNEEYVYTYVDGKLKRTPIITGREMVDEVEVLEGLSFDSIVIFNPDDVSGEGTIVNIKGRAGDA